jgi:hypothetical protein
MDSTLQTVLVVLFVVAGATWLATVAIGALLGARVRGTGDEAAIVAHARRIARLTRLATLPAAVVVAASGGWYVLGRDLSIASNWWIGTAIGAWIVCFFGATLLRAPQMSRAAQLSVEHGVGDEDVQWRIRQADLVSRGELLLLVVAGAAVAMRPGLDAFGS